MTAVETTNGHAPTTGTRFRETPAEVPEALTGPTIGDVLRSRKERRAGQPRPLYQRAGMIGACALAATPAVMWVGGLWVRGIVRDETAPKFAAASRYTDELRGYVDGPFSTQLGGLVAEQIAKGPTVVVKSNPLEMAVPCALTDDARFMIRDPASADASVPDVKLSETLAAQARSLLANGVTPQQLRIYVSGAAISITNDAAVGAPLAAC